MPLFRSLPFASSSSQRPKLIFYFFNKNTIFCLVKASVTKGEGVKVFKKIFPSRFIRICIEWI